MKKRNETQRMQQSIFSCILIFNTFSYRFIFTAFLLFSFTPFLFRKKKIITRAFFLNEIYYLLYLQSTFITTNNKLSLIHLLVFILQYLLITDKKFFHIVLNHHTHVPLFTQPTPTV